MTHLVEYAYIETTNYCNLDCSFCNRKEVIGKLQHMSVEKFRELIDKIKHHPIKEAKLMGMGEPFMHPKFHEICRIFKEAFPGAYLIVATNAQYRIKKNFTESLKYIDELYLSIDGYKDSYERDRAPAKWSKLIEFLDHLKIVNRYNCKIVTNYVVNPDNIYDIPFIEELAIENDLKELRLNIAQDWSEDKTMVGGYTDEQLSWLKSRYRDKIRGKASWEWSHCFWVKNGLYTTVEGNVKVCCLNTSAKSVGNVFEQSLDTIYSNIEYDAIRNGCNNNEPTDHCANCSYNELNPILDILLND